MNLDRFRAKFAVVIEAANDVHDKSMAAAQAYARIGAAIAEFTAECEQASAELNGETGRKLQNLRGRH